MQKEQFNKLSPDEKRTVRFDAWLAAENIEFVDRQAEVRYRQRVQRFIDVIELRKPDKVPVSLSTGFFPAYYAGITAEEAMYDYNKLSDAWQKYTFDFEPDAGPGTLGTGSGKALELLDYRLFRWPGHGVPSHAPYQCVEAEYMKAEEYDELIGDPSGFILKKYMGRICGKLEAFRKLPSLFSSLEFPTFLGGLRTFGDPDVQEALEALLEAGKEAARWSAAAQTASKNINAHGFPFFGGGFTKAPFDAIGDTLRGTVGLMNDMYRRPEKILEAVERLTPIFIDMGKKAQLGGCPVITIPLHKGADGFMSDEQFRKFYWPTLKTMILALVEEGLVPCLFAEGGYNSRLEALKELPKGKTVWHFDQTDIVRAKEELGDRICIMGNVPSSLLVSVSREVVLNHCKELIQVVGKDGGFILSTGAVVDSVIPENLKALIEAAEMYGK